MIRPTERSLITLAMHLDRFPSTHATWIEAQLTIIDDAEGAVDRVDLGLLLSFRGPCPN